VDSIIAVASGKGGVGKSLIASTLALSLQQAGKKVGLLDLDLYGPSSHIILGVKDFDFPEEDKGILPPMVHGIKYMSLIYFSKDKPGAFRGEDVTNIIIELLAITRWDYLDYLIIDMPPGIGDETLDVLSYVPQASFLVVSTPSKVTHGAVEKLVDILIEEGTPFLGVVENMMHEMKLVHTFSENVPWLGGLRFDVTIEDAIGKPSQLLATPFAKDVKELLKNLK
jgi:ATP-binding protein involved in chromosome partitioning